ncbi:MAG TPA: DNA polymerase [Candidatus Paceibacterota bacterium]|nr:DNA polymerase [Candidatus Paceibacterota bacterium]
MTTAAASKKQQQTLVILDAHAIIHRAYHALPSFTNSTGAPTGALYGIATMLLRIIETFAPDYVVAAYDLPKPTFRHAAYTEYKKGRAKAEDDLVAQIESSRTLFDAFGVPCVDAEGFEADDIIGTIVERYKNDASLHVVIASGDMDTLQLVKGKKVEVFTLKKGVTDTVVYDERAVVDRYGFAPRYLPDYKGLRGDPSDNIIGVPGIGEKTATAIIHTFGTIEKMYAALKKTPQQVKAAGVSDRLIEVLKAHEDDAFFSKTLATIRRDAPVAFTLPQQSYRVTVDEKKVRELISQYEFRSLLPRVEKVFAFKKEMPSAPVDTSLLRRAAIGLWLGYSELTTPSYEDVLNRTHTTSLDAAYEVVVDDLRKKDLLALFEKVEVPLIPLIDAMQKWGIMIDRTYFRELQKQLQEKLSAIEAAITDETQVPINLNSPKQLSHLLFGVLKLKPKGKVKASGAYSTNADVLASLHDAHPVVPRILQYREIQKLLTTYVEALLAHADESGCVHATFLQDGTSTGRFSSVDPNLQNIPIRGAFGKDIRHGFVARTGHVFIGSDYSQIELRVLAILSGDARLIATFARGEDIHTRVAAEMFGIAPEAVTPDMRRKAKVINFGILYGMGINALQKNLGSTRQEAASHYERYFATFPTVAAYLEHTKAFARTHGYTQTLFGRRRYFPGINAPTPFVRSIAERMATNAPLQGTNADIIKIAIALIDHDLKEKGIAEAVHLTLQVHDELVYEVEDRVKEQAKAIIAEAMTHVFARSPIAIPIPEVPLEVAIGEGDRLDALK